MDSSKVLQEQIDALAIEARAIMEDQANEPTSEETARFDKITDELLPQLKDKLTAAKKREAKIIALSNEQNRVAKLAEVNDLLNTPSRGHVLPINGELPGERTSNSDNRVYVKTAKLKAFKTEREAFDAGMWYRAITARLYGRGEDKDAALHCHRNGLAIDNTASEGSGTAGGYLVPPQLANTIIEVRERVGVARQVANVQPMTSDVLSIPKKTGGLTVYYPGELGAITASDKGWGNVGLTAVKRACASKISQELVDDALISIVDNVVSEQGYALALQEDNEMINGTGASSYGGVQGLLSAIGAAGVSTAAVSTTWAATTLAELITAFSFLPDRFSQRQPSILCSSNFYWACLARLLAAGGGNGIAELQAGPTQRTFMGIPVYLTSQMPTTTAVSQKSLLYGQFDQAVILGDRMGIRVSRDDSTGFLDDYVTLKATARYDIKVHEAGDASNAGAYVAYSTHA